MKIKDLHYTTDVFFFNNWLIKALKFATSDNFTGPIYKIFKRKLGLSYFNRISSYLDICKLINFVDTDVEVIQSSKDVYLKIKI